MTATDDRPLVRLRPAGLEWRLIDGEVVAIDLERAEYVMVNRTGTTLWPAVVAGATRDELAGALVERYGISPEAASADVEVFVQSLASRSLLE